MNYPLIFIAVYFIIMNIITSILYFSHKRKAIKHRWRISETILIAFSFAGGSIGAFTAMKLFRHKTKRLKFKISIPLAIILHILLFIVIINKIIKPQ